MPINEALETQKVIRLLFGGKAPGSDSILAEVYKEGGSALTEKLHQLFLLMWQQETIPQEFKDASIIHLYKRKGNHQVCDNHRGISLLPIAGKILARILLNRLTTHLDQGLLPESQCGFRKKLGTTDMVFAARQLQEKFQEQNSDLFSTYVDLTKAFDTVSREGLWKIMSKYGCPRKFISMVQQFNAGMKAQVQPFPLSNGVKQGCLLAPTLFSLANDCALNAGSEADRQRSVDKFSIACTNFGLTISKTKTEVLHQPAPGNPYVEPNITVNGQKLSARNWYHLSWQHTVSKCHH